MKERRQETVMRDPPVEKSVKLNNYLLSAAIVMGTSIGSWMGLNIEKIKDALAIITSDVRANTTDIINIKEDVKEIKKDVSFNRGEIYLLKEAKNGGN